MKRYHTVKLSTDAKEEAEVPEVYEAPEEGEPLELDEADRIVLNEEESIIE